MQENKSTGTPGGSEQIPSVRSDEAAKPQETIRPNYLEKSYGQLHMLISEGKAEQSQQAFEAMLRNFAKEFEPEIISLQQARAHLDLIKAVQDTIDGFTVVINGGEQARANFCLKEVKRSVESALQPNPYIDQEEYKKVWGMEPRAYDLMSAQNWLKLANTYEPNRDDKPSNEEYPTK